MDTQDGFKRRRHMQRIRKNDFFIGTWNVRSLFRPGALQELKEEIKKYSVGILAVQETRWPSTGILEQRDGTFYHTKSAKGLFGSGFLVSKKFKSTIIDFKPVNERISVLRFKTKFNNVSLLNVHAPIENDDDLTKDRFYNTLESIYNSLPKYDVKIVLGDFNAQIGQEAFYAPTINRYSAHTTSNSNGERAINFAAAKNLIVSSTYFPHKRIHKVTWRSPDGRVQNQIDHIMIDARHSSSIIDVRTFRGASIDSDHYLIKVKFRQRINTNLIKSASQVCRWNTNLLNCEETKETFNRILSNKLPVESQIDNFDLNDWKTIQLAIQDSAEEALGQKPRKKAKVWYDEECRLASIQKKQARDKMLQINTRANRDAYKIKRNEAYKLYRSKKRKQLLEDLQEIENCYNTQQVRNFYKNVKDSKQGWNSRNSLIRGEDNLLITDNKKVLERWKRHFENLLNNINKPIFEQSALVSTAQPYISPPSIEEVEEAIVKLNNNKAAGPDNIVSELYKTSNLKLVSYIHSVCEKIWISEQLPPDWNSSIICPLHKKGDSLLCQNYRGITLQNTICKIWSNIILQRCKPYLNEIVGDYQCGFKSGRSTTDNIFYLKQTLEKCWEFNVSIYAVFIDFKTAYDSIFREMLWKAMKDFGVPHKLVSLCQLSMDNQIVQVRLQNDLSKPFGTNIGLKQGDALAPSLFNLALEKIVRDAEINTAGTIFNKSHILLAYADDIVLLAKNIDQLKELTSRIAEEAKKMGLCINEAKTKVMEITRGAPRMDPYVTIGNQSYEKVSNFIYLGANLNCTNDYSQEVKYRVLLGNRSYFGLQHLLKSRSISTNIKSKIYTTMIRPVVVYSAETWTLSQNELRTLQVFERKVLRRIYGPIRVGRNEWRIRMNHELDNLLTESIVQCVKKQRLRWLGHLARMDDNRLPKRIYSLKPMLTRPKGRPKSRWMDGVFEDLRSLGIQNWQGLAQDRSRWKRVLKEAIIL